MKSILTSILFFSIFEAALADTPSVPVKIGPVLRDARGIALNFDYYDFDGDICHFDGYRLPTIKELALDLNPKGVYESPVPGIELQPIFTKDGAIDFYYDYSTYVQAPADRGRYLIRTSSMAISGSPVAYYRFSSDGKIQAHNLNYTIWNATRCAMPKKPSDPILTDLAKREDGSLVIIRDYENADKYCRQQGTRAPTARELALYAQSLGAQGISETPEEGYVLIEAVDVDGKEDRFYYSSKGYIQPGGDFGGINVWSSSKIKNRDSVWGQHSEDGDLIASTREPPSSAIRCTVK